MLQPGEERRRSGSHYTPRELTAPIVEHALRPVLEDLGDRPTADALLALKICDPAMGSGAFLVEACRQLAERVVIAWQTHGTLPSIPRDAEPLLHARRLVAQRCLYGVDKNPFAVNLAKYANHVINANLEKSVKHAITAQTTGATWKPALPTHHKVICAMGAMSKVAIAAINNNLHAT